MYKHLVMIAILFGLPIAAQSKCDAFPSAVTSKDISSNGLTQVFMSEKPACLTVTQGGKSRSIPLADIDQVSDIGPAPVISLSASGTYVALQFEAGEDDHVVMVFDAVSLMRIFAEKATDATWVKSRDELLLVPHYEMMEKQGTRGLISFVPGTMKRRMVAPQYLFSGGLSTDGEQLTANVFADSTDDLSTSTIIYNTENEKITLPVAENSSKK